MANKRQVKKNLKKYGKKTRGKSRRNIRAAVEKPAAPSRTITINPCVEIDVTEARPYPVAGAYVPPQTLKGT